MVVVSDLMMVRPDPRMMFVCETLGSVVVWRLDPAQSGRRILLLGYLGQLSGGGLWQVLLDTVSPVLGCLVHLARIARRNHTGLKTAFQLAGEDLVRTLVREGSVFVWRMILKLASVSLAFLVVVLDAIMGREDGLEMPVEEDVPAHRLVGPEYRLLPQDRAPAVFHHPFSWANLTDFRSRVRFFVHRPEHPVNIFVWIVRDAPLAALSWLWACLSKSANKIYSGLRCVACDMSLL
jgi:hypothetical protein